jgi:hypothetical protein
MILMTARAVAEGPAPSAMVDPLVKASAYGDKSVWSYHAKDPLPWAMFHPKDYGSSKIVFEAKGVRPVGRVPAPGVHPRIFFSPEDLPAIRKRIKEDRGSQEAWKNILCFANAIKLTYDENADYAKPDWANGAWHVHGRTAEIHRIGGYGKNREDYFGLLAAGKNPEKTFGKNPSGFYFPAAIEAFRCLIADDAQGAATLARAVETAVQLEQERRAREDKPVKPGEPPRPSTPRYACCNLGLVYDFIYNWLTPQQKQLLHDELVLLSSWSDNYGTFNNAEASRSNWATFTYWVWDLMAIEGEPGFNDLKFLGLYRGWRNFFTYSFFESGGFYEGEGKMLFGMDAVVAFDRVAPKYGLDLLSQHPQVRSHYARFTALSVLPTQDKYAIFDILGSMGGGLCTPQDLVVAHYLYPNDTTIDFVYRTLVGDDYRTLPMPSHSWNNLITCGIFATSHQPEITPEKLKLPLTFFCGQRAMLMTRSSWSTNATMLTMHVRGASGGHPYRDRNGIMLAAQGRTWITIPGKDIGGWACNTLLMDEAEQNATTPARVVDFADEPNATFMTGDAKYCWDWVWRNADRTLQGNPITREDLLTNNVATGLSWKLVEQCFNDFAWTKSEREIYKRPLKFNAHWIAVDGTLSPVIRQVNTPVLKSFRTAGLVRGPRPYVLVVDDAQRDPLPARYDWNATLPEDVVEAKQPKGTREENDILLAGKGSLAGDGSVKTGEPVLLIRILSCAGHRLPTSLGLREKANVLSLRTEAASPEFKILLYAFRAGDRLPTTTWNSSRTSVSIDFPEQKDVIRLTPSSSGKTDVIISRRGEPLVNLSKAPAPLADPDSEALTERLKQIPSRLDRLRKQSYDPYKQTGFLAGWQFEKAVEDAVQPVPGSSVAAVAIPLENRQWVTGMNGRKALAIGEKALQASMDFAKQSKEKTFTVACWVKTKSGPFMGGVVNVEGLVGSEFIQGAFRFTVARVLNDNWPSSMFSSWTHLVFTCDGKQVCAYRNGLLLSSVPCPADMKFGWGKKFSLGGKGGYGDAEVSVQSLSFYTTSMTAEDVENLYLWGKYIPAR